MEENIWFAHYAEFFKKPSVVIYTHAKNCNLWCSAVMATTQLAVLKSIRYVFQAFLF
jgi:hypothetical protein